MCSQEALDENLCPSKLGTKQHWDDVYQSELQTFGECGNEGEVWFGESTSRRLLSYLNSLGPSVKGDPVIDLGCGNGMLLVDLWEAGFRNLLGVDYSDHAISLASSVATSKGCLAKFEVKNIVNWSGPEKSFRIALDKGTYDAISLDPEDAISRRKSYLDNVCRLLLPGGLLIITTCNWTEKEIIAQFSTELEHKLTLPSPNFTFGGMTGNKVTTAVFEKS